MRHTQWAVDPAAVLHFRNSIIVTVIAGVCHAAFEQGLLAAEVALPSDELVPMYLENAIADVYRFLDAASAK